MSEWYDIDSFCKNCHKPLQAKWAKITNGIVISGCKPIDFRHADGSTECIIRRTASAYDNWKANKELEAAQRIAWANES